MSKYNQQGISMIEVLITIVVMSFGFLPIVSFQMGVLKHLQNSNQQYIVTTLASSIGESIRANEENASDYNDVEISSESAFFKACYSGSDCTIAETDLERWEMILTTNNFFEPKAIVLIDGSTATIDISWGERSLWAAKDDDGNVIRQSYILKVPL